MADEQAEMDRQVAAEEKAAREWQEYLAELVQTNCQVSLSFQFLALDLTIIGQDHVRAQVELEAGPSRPKGKVSTMPTNVRFWY